MAHLLVSKWGNSLAVRIPTEFIRQADLKDGDHLEIHIGADGSLCLQKTNWDRKAFAIELAQAQESMPIGSSVIEELRNQARY
jgi:antitoxin MazE